MISLILGILAVAALIIIVLLLICSLIFGWAIGPFADTINSIPGIIGSILENGFLCIAYTLLFLIAVIATVFVSVISAGVFGAIKKQNHTLRLLGAMTGTGLLYALFGWIMGWLPVPMMMLTIMYLCVVVFYAFFDHLLTDEFKKDSTDQEDKAVDDVQVLDVTEDDGNANREVAVAQPASYRLTNKDLLEDGVRFKRLPSDNVH